MAGSEGQYHRNMQYRWKKHFTVRIDGRHPNSDSVYRSYLSGSEEYKDSVMKELNSRSFYELYKASQDTSKKRKVRKYHIEGSIKLKDYK